MIIICDLVKLLNQSIKSTLMITKEQLEKYVLENIPLSQALGIQVKSASLQEVILSAPFLNNINHKKTVFGGSLHAVATLACWSLIYMHLENLKTFDIVITSSSIQYILPVIADFNVECKMAEPSRWNRFKTSLLQKGKGRIELHAAIFQDKKLAVDYLGTFAAIKRGDSLNPNF